MILTQREADELINVSKKLKNRFNISFPPVGKTVQIEAVSAFDPKVTFLFDIQRKTLNIHKCTYNTRSNGEMLIRIDIEGPSHQNPNGIEVPCPHIHIYKEGFGDSWAYPLSEQVNTDPSNLVQVLIDFLKYNQVLDRPTINEQGGDLV